MTVNTKRPIILCFVSCYLPGYRFGGPVRTIANFVDHFGDEFDIYIVTRDRDSLDSHPYEGVTIDGWNRVGKASVFYASRKILTLAGVARLLRNTSHDILYLNSFFAFAFTALPLLATRLGLAPKNPCVIAPRGEFSAGALALKAQRKWLYLKATNAIRLYSHLVWQASSQFECADIRHKMGAVADVIKVACDMPPVGLVNRTFATPQDTQFSARPLRLIFLSRINQIKNLDFLLQALSFAKSNIHLSIYGPLEDPDYWVRCQSLIASLPAGFAVDYMGEVSPPQVIDVFSNFDLFVLPTRGENYGHVVLESLMSGTPVLISDKTPWLPSSDGAVQVLPLGDPFLWAAALDRWAVFSWQDQYKLRHAAFTYASKYLKDSGAVDQTRSLFFNML